jgi:putative transposase
MQIGYRFRLYPSKQQQATLLKWIGCQRFIYNAKVSEDRYYRGYARKFASNEFAPVDQEYSRFIGEETKWLREVPSQVLRNGAVRWRQGYERFFKRLGGRPTIHKKHGAQSAWLTSELFCFEDGKLVVGKGKFPVGEIAFKAHREFTVPKSIRITAHAGRWYLSFSNDNGEPEYSEEEIASWLQTFTPEELEQRTLGLDRGLVLPVAASNGVNFEFRPIEQKRMRKRAKAIKRFQRRLAKRQCKTSKRRAKLGERIATLHRKNADLRRDFAHQASRKLADDPTAVLYVFEDLKIKNMTASAKGTVEKPGKKVKQKAGLNRSILRSAWGQVKNYLQYKARRQHKLVVAVSPIRSSQECAACGHTHPDNRISQSVFVCQACGNKNNADTNAGCVLSKRGVDLIVSGKSAAKTKKRVSITKQVRFEEPEPEAQASYARGENVSRIGQLVAAQSSWNRDETLTTALSA